MVLFEPLNQSYDNAERFAWEEPICYNSRPVNQKTIVPIQRSVQKSICDQVLDCFYDPDECSNPSIVLSLEEVLQNCSSVKIENHKPGYTKTCNFRKEDLEYYQSLIKKGISHSKNGKTVLIVDKVAHEMHLYLRGEKVKTYSIEIGRSYDDKKKQGDGCTPEGVYKIVRTDVFHPSFYKALMLDYPNARNKEKFKKLKEEGFLRKSDQIGYAIEIHGAGNRGFDWTAGCIAISNSEIDNLFQRINPKKNQNRIEVVIVRYSSEEIARKYNCTFL